MDITDIIGKDRFTNSSWFGELTNTIDLTDIVLFFQYFLANSDQEAMQFKDLIYCLFKDRIQISTKSS